MSLRSSLALLALLLVTLPGSAAAQAPGTPPVGSIGLAAALQSEQFDLFVPIWLGERFVLAPAVGVAWAEGSSTSIALGVAPRLYTSLDPVGTYLGARAGVLMTSPDEGESTSDLIVGAAFGGEYYLSPRFSLGVESQLNLTISDEASARFGNPGKKNLNSAAVVFATVYF